MAVRLISQYEEVVRQMEMDVSFNWLMKRLLIICLRRLYDEDANMNEVFITTIHVFAKNSNNLEYLIRKGEAINIVKNKRFFLVYKLTMFYF